MQLASTGTGATVTTTGSPVKISGSLFGGQQPITGAKVYVLAVGTGGYLCGSTSCPSTSLLDSSNGTLDPTTGNYYVPTDSSGNFTIGSRVHCASGLQAYLYASGGDPQLSRTNPENNTAAGLLAPLGQCNSNNAATPPDGTSLVNITEVTTVVTAYALAGFATDALHISTANTTLAATGVANAMATALNLVNLTQGTLNSNGLTNNGTAVVPADKINALADILASCINSSGATSGNCSKLFTDTNVNSSTGDTAAAAIALARNPFTSKASDLYVLVGNNPVFATQQDTPSEWTLGLHYTAQSGQGVNFYSGAVDSSGNVWFRGTNPANTLTTFVRYSPTGSQLTKAEVNLTANPLNPAIHLAVDSSDTVWSGIYGAMMNIAPGGAQSVLPNPGCTIPGTLTSVAFGADGAAYAGEYDTNGLFKFSSAQCTAALTASATAPTTPAPNALSGYVAVEPDGSIVTSGSTSSNTLAYKYNPGTSAWTSFSAGGDYVSTDKAGDIWKFGIIGGTTNDSLYVYPENGGSSTPNFYQGGFTQTGYASTRAGNEGVHIDGAGNAWVTVCPNNCGTATALPDVLVGAKLDGTPITPSTGLALPYNETGAHAVALDGSGNVWIGMADGTLLQFLGLATPVATPILSTQIGKMP
jgi:hypothetical protein